MEIRTLTNQILRELIDHIDVYEVEGRGKNRTQRMVIYYKFVGYPEIPSHLTAPNHKSDLRQDVAVSMSPASRRTARVSCSTRTASQLRKRNKKRSRPKPAPGT